MPDIRRFATPEDLIRAAKREFADAVHGAVNDHERCMVALSGGSTPRRLYEALADEDLPWERTFLCFGDERAVPPDHPESNYRMVRESLLSRAPIPPTNVYRIPSEIPDPMLAAESYESTLRTAFHLRHRRWPRFDLVLLGLGADGHTASLFPGTSALEERERLVAATYVETLKAARITLTYPVFNAAALVVFLVSGADKAQALKSVLQGDDVPEPPPARRIKPMTGRVVWMIDEAAASALDAH